MNSSSVTQNPLETGCRGLFRPFQENKSPKNGQFSEEKASGLGGFNFWNYISAILVGTCQLRTFWHQPAVSTVGDDIFHLKTDKSHLRLP
jgi:hypothetical protein